MLSPFLRFPFRFIMLASAAGCYDTEQGMTLSAKLYLCINHSKSVLRRFCGFGKEGGINIRGLPLIKFVKLIEEIPEPYSQGITELWLIMQPSRNKACTSRYCPALDYKGERVVNLEDKVERFHALLAGSGQGRLVGIEEKDRAVIVSYSTAVHHQPKERRK